VDARVWPARDGRLLSLRAIARETAWFFRRSLRQNSDPFSFRLLFSILEGQAPSLLELPDRPAAYDDVGRSIRWGEVLPQLQGGATGGHWDIVGGAGWSEGSFEAHVKDRARARERFHRRAAREAQRAGADRLRTVASPPPSMGEKTRRLAVAAPARRASESYRGDDRRIDVPDLEALTSAPDADRRVRPGVLERRIRGGRPVAVPFPDRYLTRSSYEQVFLRLVAGRPMVVGGRTYRPVKMRGWYHALFAGPSGEERRRCSGSTTPRRRPAPDRRGQRSSLSMLETMPRRRARRQKRGNASSRAWAASRRHQDLPCSAWFAVVMRRWKSEP
jgi:hypothetical protein